MTPEAARIPRVGGRLGVPRAVLAELVTKARGRAAGRETAPAQS